MNISHLQDSAIALTQELVAFNTVNPPGQEKECAKFLGEMLEDGGFSVTYHEFAAGRTSLVAKLDGHGGKLPICFTGHTDTVPLGTANWSVDQIGGEIADGKLYGRGSSDMKSGVAAIVVAGLELAKVPNRHAGIILVITASEETGCEGAEYLATVPGVLGRAGAIIVGEPTCNYPLLGHKGSIWMEATTSGITAHGSMPEQGVNAIYKMASALSVLEKYEFDVSDSLLGKPTLNVGIISGGENVNSVPDRARIEIDIRTVAGQKSDDVYEALKKYLGDEVQLRLLQASDPVSTDPNDDWIHEVHEIMTPILGEKPEPRSATYFTDAGELTPALGNPPTIILGPGEMTQAHKTDEFCYVSRIEEAVEAYFRIGEKWILDDV
jgi:succinyl-diaminopimelate desuccinylase